MIADFVASWPLFADTYLAAWLIAGLLSLVGVWVVARDQIFLGAAVSQASTLGTAVALFLQGMASSHALESDALTFLFAVLASISAALITSHARGRKGGESPEAITGWVFLVGGSVPVIMMAQETTDMVNRRPATNQAIGPVCRNSSIRLGPPPAPIWVR